MEVVKRIDVVRDVHVTERGMNGAYCTVLARDNNAIIKRFKIVAVPTPLVRFARTLDSDCTRMILRELKPTILTLFCNIRGTIEYRLREDGTYSIQRLEPIIFDDKCHLSFNFAQFNKEIAKLSGEVSYFNE